MELKNSIVNKSLKFNFELNKHIFNDSLILESCDIQRSIYAIAIMCEHIKYCCFDNYIGSRPKKIEKYCRLLLRYESCNQAVIVKECKMQLQHLLELAMNQPYTKEIVDLSLCLSQSNYSDICEQCNELMTNAMGTHVRGTSF